MLAVWVILWVMGGALLGSDSGAGPVSGGLFCLAAFPPGLAVAARRLHDTDRSAWWLLLLLVPIAGWGVLFYYLAEPGMPGPNKFGDRIVFAVRRSEAAIMLIRGLDLHVVR